MKFKDTKYGNLSGQHYEGDIDLDDIGLTSLEGAPEKVGGGFYCFNNKLATLKGAPEKVGGNFDCFNNNLTTLEGAPETVGGDFYCFKNELTSLEGAPKKVGGDFNCNGNNLETLEGAPESVDGKFLCFNNPNPHLETEYKVRNENPNLTEDEISMEMYKRTDDDDDYLPDELKDIFLF